MSLKSFWDTLKLLESSDHWKMTLLDVGHDVVRTRGSHCSKTVTAQGEGGSKTHSLDMSVFRGRADFEALPVGCLGPAPPAHTPAALLLLSASTCDTSDHKDEWDPRRFGGRAGELGIVRQPRSDARPAG